MTRRPATTDEILTAVDKLLSETSIRPGMSEWELNRNGWTNRSAICERMSYRTDPNDRTTLVSPEATLAQLRKLAKAGVLIEEGSGRHTRFTTPAVFAAAIAAERNLSAGERAERTAAAVTAQFERNRLEYGDALWRQPVDTSYGWIPTDGLAEAVEAGMVAKVHAGGKTRYMPPDHLEAWQEAYDAEVAREEAHRARCKAACDRVLELLPPPTGTRLNITITLDQAEWLAGVLAPAAEVS